ncbi:MAG: putative holin-like toxin [Ruminococcus sp.]
MEGHFSLREGGVSMVTYEAMFLFGTLIVAIITLVIHITKKK